MKNRDENMKRLWLICFLGLGVAAGERQTGSTTEVSFIDVLTSSFLAWDVNQDGTLAKLEIDAALANSMIKGEAAAALAVVKRLNRSKTWSAIPLTLDGLTAVPKTKEGPNLSSMFDEGCKRIANAKRVLFVEAQPSVLKLQQGDMGNCFSLAPLGCMLSRNPAQVKAMFKENDDGTYEVKIGKRNVRVAAPTDAEIALSSSNESTGLWSNVYEKAAGVARNELRKEGDRVSTPLDAIARGGSAGTMLAFITGNEMERFTLKWAKGEKTTPAESESKLTELRAKLITAFAERRCVTTGTLSPTMPGMRGGHAYGVVGYEAVTDQIMTWDPHGDTFEPRGMPGPEAGYSRRDGLCEMPLVVFVKQFSGLAFELFQ